MLKNVKNVKTTCQERKRKKNVFTSMVGIVMWFQGIFRSLDAYGTVCIAHTGSAFAACQLC